MNRGIVAGRRAEAAPGAVAKAQVLVRHADPGPVEFAVAVLVVVDGHGKTDFSGFDISRLFPITATKPNAPARYRHALLFVTVRLCLHKAGTMLHLMPHLCT